MVQRGITFALFAGVKQRRDERPEYRHQGGSEHGDFEKHGIAEDCQDDYSC
jgi:hypothetical protein